ncbi:NUDIX hydrolase [Jiulongibacter sediminis]|jgi:ADP-ribose pyrophosphatase YjhB (NUDIX family)|uniref:NUDIX domain-containing protein n=1 Tax=Jiulongibacter sediminis TaxID=1605367 RepID=UPI0026F1AFED|nr:NUDIX hydrolase [Jiulongibacter sediminis]
MNEQKNPWTTIREEVVYANNWIEVVHKDVLNPNGNPGVYGQVNFKNIAIGVIPVDEEGNTWLVGQYRFPLEEYSWEIPEGGCPEGENMLDAAKRELKEETGLEASSYEMICKIHTSNSVCKEVAYIYLAKDLKQGKAQPEDTEQLVVKKLKLSEAIQMVMDNKITDSMSVAGLLKAERFLKGEV